MKRMSAMLPQLAIAAVLTAGLIAVLTAFSGSGYSATPAQSQYGSAPPKNVAAPAISGTAVVGSTLTASPGSWESATSPSYSYQWLRCNAKGEGCSNISGATSTKYLLQGVDAGNSVRVTVTAKNAGGATAATAPYRAVAAQTTTPIASSKTIAAANVVLPDRLTVDRVQYSPSRLSSRAPFVARFHVVNAKGQSVSGALVYVLSLPYGWAQNSAEVSTDGFGWATLTVQPTSRMPLRRGAALVMFVRARVSGQSLLAGSSTRRLVQISID